jgi:hypothetical protein
MSTTYDATPSVLDRVVGADLIVVGVVRGPVRTSPVEDAERPRVHGWFEMRPERVLAGEPPEAPILVRVLGDGSVEDPSWTVRLPDDGRVVAMLARDVGPELPDNLFAPCFAGLFAIAGDGTVRVPEEALDDASRRLADADGASLTIDQIHRLADRVAQRRAENERRLEAEEPAEVRAEARPDLTEQPEPGRAQSDHTPGGGEDTTLG